MDVAQAVVQLRVGAVDLLLGGVQDLLEGELDVLVKRVPVPLQKQLHGDALAGDAGAQAVHAVPPLPPDLDPAKPCLGLAVARAVLHEPGDGHALALLFDH
eukprot:scaffold386286_cov48-Prasinocladus_malaysianus.AAC.1